MNSLFLTINGKRKKVPLQTHETETGWRTSSQSSTAPWVALEATQASPILFHPKHSMSPMFPPGPSDSFSFFKWNKVLVAQIFSFLQRAQLAYSKNQVGRWFDGLFQATSRSQEMGWEASCPTGRAGFRCLGKYESKASFVGKSEEEDLPQQPQGQGWMSAMGHRPISQGDFKTLEGGTRALGCTELGTFYLSF